MAVEAARASGLTKGLLLGTRSSSRLCAKKQMRLRQPDPSLHSCVRYLQTEGEGCSGCHPVCHSCLQQVHKLGPKTKSEDCLRPVPAPDCQWFKSLQDRQLAVVQWDAAKSSETGTRSVPHAADLAQGQIPPCDAHGPGRPDAHLVKLLKTWLSQPCTVASSSRSCSLVKVVEVKFVRAASHPDPEAVPAEVMWRAASPTYRPSRSS